MDSNTHSNHPPEWLEPPPDLLEPPEPLRSPEPPVPPEPAEWAEWPDDDLGELAAVVDKLAARDLDGWSTTLRAERMLAWRLLLNRQEGLWLQELAAVDASGAAGAEPDQPVGSTAVWLRRRLRMSVGAARGAVRTARALFRGSLPETAAALTAGEISAAHAQVVADGTQDLPDHVKLEADPVLVEAARRLDPPQLRRLVGHLCQVADPDGADAARDRRYERRGLWLSPTWDDMVAINGLLEPEAGAIVRSALEPLARPAEAGDDRQGGQRTADALTELCRRALEGGGLPKAGGVRPQLLVTVDLDTLVGHPGSLGGDMGSAGPLDREACRRLACDGAVTRVMVTRQPGHQHPSSRSGHGIAGSDPSTDHSLTVHPDPTFGDSGRTADPEIPVGLQARLRAALALLPLTLGGAPSQPLEVGRATRVVSPAQRAALAVRDRGCAFPGCDRPLAWCDAHHLWHWIDGGPTDLPNLALLCRAHHRTVHEGGWQLTRGPDGRFTATPTDQTRRRHGAVT